MDNIAIIKRFNEEIWNKGNIDLVDELVSIHFRSNSLHLNPKPVGIAPPADYKEAVIALRKSLPDYIRTFEEVISSSDKVIVRWMASGTHTHSFMGLAPTGKKIQFSGISIFRIEEGKIAEEWYVWDRLGLYQQLDLIKI